MSCPERALYIRTVRAVNMIWGSLERLRQAGL